MLDPNETREFIETNEGQEENYNVDFFLDHSKSATNWDMPSQHKHNCHELYFLLKGSTQYCIDDAIYNINAGDVVMVPKGIFHRTLMRTRKEYDRLLIHFTDDFAETFMQQMGEDIYEQFLFMGSVRLSERHIEELRLLYDKLKKEYNHQQDIYSNMLLSCTFCEIITLLLRHGSNIKKNSKKSENRILDAVHYINNHYSEEITLTGIANLCCMEPTYFSKCFRRMIGSSFQEYLIQVRLKIATEFLITSPLSISTIAQNCGFSSSNHFGDIFKKYKGVSPRTYRKENFIKQ